MLKQFLGSSTPSEKFSSSQDSVTHIILKLSEYYMECKADNLYLKLLALTYFNLSCDKATDSEFTLVAAGIDSGLLLNFRSLQADLLFSHDITSTPPCTAAGRAAAYKIDS